ncbi:hypothetical protein HZH68_015080 [Vespula germanica]|uniref:Uncharacterized protein n=1 Tax=Vespula germanica TaxID=30212 RepID=A0A834J8Y8_VESGE|nr:hypothetical protein HZH68_015080 [Vespula germanica]
MSKFIEVICLKKRILISGDISKYRRMYSLGFQMPVQTRRPTKSEKKKERRNNGREEDDDHDNDNDDDNDPGYP